MNQTQMQPSKALISYARLSVKRQNGRLVEDVSESVDRQLEHGRERADRDGHTIAYELVDDGKSAYDPNVVRESWEQALHLIRTGQSDGFLAWNEDRMCRQPLDGIHLMNAAKAAGIPVMVGTGSKVYDFTDSTDEFMFLVSCGIGKKSSDDTSRRVKDKQAANRKNGKQHGKLAYGFMVNPADPSGPRIVNPAEAAVIRHVAEQLLAGATWGSILGDLEQRGVQINGRSFTRSSLRSMLMSGRMAGDLTHHGKVSGRIPGEPILDRATFDALVAELSGRSIGSPRQTRFLLSGLLRCECGAFMYCVPLTDRKTHTYRVYKCRGDAGARCAATIMAHHAEAKVRDAVLEWQLHPKRRERLSKASNVAAAKIASLNEEKARLVRLHDRYQFKLDNHIWDEDEYARNDDINDARIIEINRKIAAYGEAETVAELALAAVEDEYDKATDEGKRRLMKTTLASVTVLRGRLPDPRDRVVCEPR